MHIVIAVKQLASGPMCAEEYLPPLVCLFPFQYHIARYKYCNSSLGIIVSEKHKDFGTMLQRRVTASYPLNANFNDKLLYWSRSLIERFMAKAIINGL